MVADPTGSARWIGTAFVDDGNRRFLRLSGRLFGVTLFYNAKLIWLTGEKMLEMQTNRVRDPSRFFVFLQH